MKILLIDDDEINVKSLASFLEVGNHRCQVFTAPQQAMEEYRRNAYDVVITDMIMPGMNGLEVLQQARSVNPGARVIVVTGHIEAEIIIAALNNGACAFLSKPLKVEELMTALQRIEQENRDLERARWEQVCLAVGCVRLAVEHVCLAVEHARLKDAFEGLRDLLKDRQKHSYE